MSNTAFKIAFAFVLLIVGYVFALAPRYAISFDTQIFTLGNMMASGVLLGAGIIHQLPDAQELLKNFGSDYPLAGFICGLSFCCFLILEEFMHLITEDDHDDHDDNYVHEEERCYDPWKLVEARSDCNKESEHIPSESMNSVEINDNYGSTKEIKDLETPLGSYPTDHNHTHKSHDHSHTGHNHSHETNLEKTATPRVPNTKRSKICRHSITMLSGNTAKELRTNNFHHHDHAHVDKHLHGSMISSFALLVALSLHSILAGFGLGIDDSPTAFGTAVAIISHKLFAAYSLGSTLTAASEGISDGIFYMTISIFAFSTPLGIIAGVLMGDSLQVNEYVKGVIQAIVAGTFLYIAIVEVGMKELLVCRVQAGATVIQVSKRLEIAKLGSLLFGYSVMAALAVFY
eukprot:CAMPEP_0172478102 /NCGR_PEP_ID=MMETSP1066-20121228/1871_1 /TAXON_ID=671091 /ORGANISM="Coscinodiscus wailesii, Strain CCMP2513" /LENGTH=401 /DNA_ID=CAMNT_0013237383 /DNA_START=33 /DNA_END=1238 /DNA_ORIENTATION=+